MAPETVLIDALWDATASLARTGAAYEEIWPERPPLGSAIARTAVILPLATVTWTSTSPYCVDTRDPVMVMAAAPATGAALGVPVELAPVVGLAATAIGPVTAAAGLDDGLNWKSSISARTVVTSAMAPRFGNMGRILPRLSEATMRAASEGRDCHVSLIFVSRPGPTVWSWQAP